MAGLRMAWTWLCLSGSFGIWSILHVANKFRLGSFCQGMFLWHLGGFEISFWWTFFAHVPKQINYTLYISILWFDVMCAYLWLLILGLPNWKKKEDAMTSVMHTVTGKSVHAAIWSKFHTQLQDSMGLVQCFVHSWPIPLCLVFITS